MTNLKSELTNGKTYKLFIAYLLILLLVARLNAPEMDLRIFLIVTGGAMFFTFMTITSKWMFSGIEKGYLEKATKTDVFAQYNLKVVEKSIVGKIKSLGFSITPRVHLELGWLFKITIYLPGGKSIARDQIKSRLKKHRVRHVAVEEDKIHISDWRPKYPPFKQFRFDENFFNQFVAILTVIEEEIKE